MKTLVERVNNTQYSTIEDIIVENVCNNKNEQPFYVVNMQDIYRKHMDWLVLMPRVKPFYAVKCNDNPEVLAFLASLGTGFDCASKVEIDTILGLGVKPDNIIYANPCKTKSFIKHAQHVGVNLMTFDNELELHKVAQLHPNSRLVLRIKGDDSHSRCKFNVKFGADLEKAYDLLSLASKLYLNVVGVSFHIGSDCDHPSVYTDVIARCRYVFDLGAKLGHKMTILDIGGGFPGNDNAPIPFEQHARIINRALDIYFPKVDDHGNETNVTIIAEPGRYYVASAFTLAAMVIAKRVETLPDGQECFMYYLNDGVYGAFNNTIFEHATAEPSPLLDEGELYKRNIRLSTLWGPTCDSIDCVKRDFYFPELNIGEWLVFPNMGAYTCCVATTFNGFERAKLIIADDKE
ncbi:Antizyme inhibitor 2 [Fragariocoptes setiger]|uniref:ornithine decarboxylase n=1 Tax=Fragariocoptes setiger TaxID=1670756 RepID=A0ABQ7S9M8_9ACAR|nr:Antizyme inhibitor 2 [Fragariocoptes setiger]